MNTFVVLAFAIAAVVAKPTPGEEVLVSQDTLGNYNLKYVIGGISRVENRDIHGNVAGGYAYIDPHGIQRKIEFIAGGQGVHAVGADIPLPVQDTPEVAHAKAAHFAALHAAELAAPPQPLELLSPHFGGHASLIRTEPVPSPAFHQALLLGALPETHEVAAARAEHLAAHAAASGNILLH